MHPVATLVCFGIRQVVGVDVQDVAAAVERYYTDQSQTLPRALATANDKAWRALGVALAGDGLCDKVKVFFASGDDKGLREQVSRFLNGNRLNFEGTPVQFREACLKDLKKARQAGWLSAQNLPAKEIARQTTTFQRYADSLGLVTGAEQVVSQVADSLTAECPDLAKLLRQPTPGGSPLLVAAFAYFFRREVEKDDELANGLFFDNLKQLSTNQAKAFTDLGKSLDTLGERFDQAFDEMAQELERIRIAAEEARKAAEEARKAAEKAAFAANAAKEGVLNLAAEQQRVSGLQMGRFDEILVLMRDVQGKLGNAGMQQGEVKPRHSFSIRGEDELRAVHALLDRFRRLPEDQRKQLPALLNGLGKLQVGIGEFDAATKAFNQVADEVSDPAAKAEAFYNAYLAALEKGQWGEALGAIRQAAR